MEVIQLLHFNLPAKLGRQKVCLMHGTLSSPDLDFIFFEFGSGFYQSVLHYESGSAFYLFLSPGPDFMH